MKIRRVRIARARQSIKAELFVDTRLQVPRNLSATLLDNHEFSITAFIDSPCEN